MVVTVATLTLITTFTTILHTLTIFLQTSTLHTVTPSLLHLLHTPRSYHPILTTLTTALLPTHLSTPKTFTIFSLTV